MNKQLSILMVMIMIAAPLAAMPFGVGGAYVPIETPAFAGGDGSIGDPYHIVNVSDLQNMSVYLDAHYILTKNIDASNTSVPGHWANDGGLGFDPIGDLGNPFTASLDGQNFIINNLYINRPGEDDIGLFGYTDSTAEIMNVIIENADITGNDDIGGLVGNNSAIINHCHTEVVLTGHNNMGGLVGGSTPASSITNSYAVGEITGNTYIGGFIGKNYGTISTSYANVDAIGAEIGGFVGWNFNDINDCYATGSIDCWNVRAGGFVDWNWAGTISNCYSTGQVTSFNDLGSGFNEINYATVTNCFWDVDTSGLAASTAGTGHNTAQAMTQASYTGWDFGSVWWMVDGETRPFLRMEYDTTIRNSHQLQLMIMNLTANYTLANDLDLDITNPASMWGTSISDGEGFVPIGNSGDFTGNLDGQDFVIDSLYINRAANYIGLFNNANPGAVIENVNLINASVKGNQYVGGLVAYFSGDGSTGNTFIKNCSVEGNVSGIYLVGGLVGYSFYGDIYNSFTTGTVTLTSGSFGGSGGLIGLADPSIINNCYSLADVNGNDDVGGFIGWANVDTISDCYSTGHVNGNTNVGGFIGSNYGSASNCSASGNISGDDYVGGLVGANNGGTVSICTSNGTVTGSGDYVGGLIGFSDGPVSDSKSFSKVSNIGAGNRYTGGLIGRQDGSTVSFCEAHGNVTGTGDTGGLIGFTRWGTTIVNCSTYGATKSVGNYVGGLVGNNYATILDSHTYGEVGRPDLYAWIGGLVGRNLNQGIIRNSSAHGDVFGGSNVGGLVGENANLIDADTISDCSSNGTVTGHGNNIGGLIGLSSSTVSNSTSFGDVSNTYPGVGNYYATGGLIGKLDGSTVSSSEAYGNVIGTKFHTGGLIGHIAPSATVMDSSAHGVTNGASSTIGGLVGMNEGTITNSSAYGDTGDTKYWTGGLVGRNYNTGLIQNSSAYGNVFGGGTTGGFAGENSGIIERCYSTGDITASTTRVGGFVGWNNGNFVGEITDCYSQGNITGDDGGIGGFVGNHSYDASITNVYSTGLVIGNADTGGLVGVNWISTVTDSHWDIETSGQATSVNGTGHDTNAMMSQSTFTNWDFTNVWGIVEANTYPFLRALETGFTADADLEITLTDLQDPASTNGTLTYMLTLTNHGPHNAADVYVNITLPLGVTFLDSNPPLNVNGIYLDADVGTLLNGDTVGAFINVSVDSFGTGELNCTAFVTSSTQDPGAFDNETYELTQLHLAPVAVNDAETLDEDSGASTIYVLENDTDVETDDIIIDSVTQPNNGTVVITEAGKNLTYEPDADWNGINTFNYTIIDALGGRDMATVTITVLSVDDVSIAVNDTYTVVEDSAATTLDVLVNDYDGDGDAITISTAIQPSNGTISIAVDGLSIDYTPNADFFGTDSFTYNVSSGIEPATVTIDVTPVNDVPVITTTDIITATEDVLYSVDYNATDVDLDTLTWSLTSNASWLSIVAGDGILSGTPTSAGIYWVNVTVDDGNGGLDWTNFTLTVTGTAAPTDTDGDGTPDDQDDFPDDANETTDTDGDGVGDNADAFPDDATEDTDSDDDGTGDNGDAFPYDPAEDTDTDGDNVGDNADAFPTDPAASTDADDDGLPDAWNDGYTADDSTTGLVLDDDPLNPADLGPDDDNTGANTWLYIIIIMVIVGAIAGFLVMRGRGKEPIAEEPVEEMPVEQDMPQETASDAPDTELEELDL